METHETAHAMVECENLVKIYKTKDIEVLALQGLEVRIEKGELMAIIGNSGSGKSTFLNMIGGLDRPSAGKLLVDGKKVDTPPKELELLYHLAATPNRVYTRNQLLDEVWGFDYFGDSRTVDVHIKRLREKIENVSDQWELKTVWGVGYKFEVK